MRYIETKVAQRVESPADTLSIGVSCCQSLYYLLLAAPAAARRHCRHLVSERCAADLRFYDALISLFAVRRTQGMPEELDSLLGGQTYTCLTNVTT